MDTLKIMLVATVAMLLTAFGLSWRNMQANPGSPKEVGDQSLEIQRLKLEQDRLEFEILQFKNQVGAAKPAPSTAPATTPAPSSGSVTGAPDLAPQDVSFPDAGSGDRIKKGTTEESGFLDNRNRVAKADIPDRATEKVSRRLALIKNSGVMAKVKEWVETPEDGAFALLEVISPDNVQIGTELLIRRNGGVLGKLRVDHVDEDGGVVADPVTAFGAVKPVAGDELILVPFFADDSDMPPPAGGR